MERLAARPLSKVNLDTGDHDCTLVTKEAATQEVSFEPAGVPVVTWHACVCRCAPVFWNTLLYLGILECTLVV